ncbi:MAG: ClbS/DfsB family four-helix bundle protein [Pyrinomonadaceae bacterium]
MGKRLSKSDLLHEIEVEKGKLDKLLIALRPDEMIESGVTPGGWSVKDILAHLIGWQQMILSFHEAERSGKVPEVPGHGLTWRETPKLNSLIYQEYRETPLADILKSFEASHRSMLGLMDKESDTDFVTVGRFRWAGPSWTLSDFVRAETASHYRWATNHIKKWMRVRQKQNPKDS